MRCRSACGAGLQPGACGGLGGGAEEGAAIFPDQAVRIVIATKPVDFRKGHDGLAAMAHAELGFARKAGVMVVLRSKRGDRIKVLFWDGSGIVMICKRLEQGGFAWPKVGEGVMRLSRVQFEALFVSLDWRRIQRPDRRIQPRQNDSDCLVNMGFCKGVRYKPPCLRPPVSPLIRIVFHPPCVRRLQPCKPESQGCRRRPNVRMT